MLLQIVALRYIADMVAITRPVNELSQNLSFMMESLYKVSVSLSRQEFV